MRILSIVSRGGPLILADMPDRFVWRRMLPHLTALMRSHGLQQKDILYGSMGMTYMSGPDMGNEEPYRSEGQKMDAAFAAAEAGDPKRLSKFYLYRYRPDAGYVLVRAPIAVSRDGSRDHR